MFPLMFPIMLPTDYDIPPTLYSIMNSIVNYDREEKVKINELEKYAREKIFDFNYPLSDKVNKEDFEVLILKKFKMYRIGYQTMTAFKNALEVKLNEVMPKYNKMFNMLDGWDLFNDGEKETRNVIDSRNTNSTSSSNGTNISDRRYSELPQNRLEDVQDGKYITDYNYDTNTNSITGNNSINDNGTLNETINRSPSDKVRMYKEFQDDVKSIYTMIFNDLDDLFYGLVM